MNKIVIYPGRFQPMLRHHVEVYDYLVKTFSDAEVFIGTSDKVTDTSPFNFKDMKAMDTGTQVTRPELQLPALSDKPKSFNDFTALPINEKRMIRSDARDEFDDLARDKNTKRFKDSFAEGYDPKIHGPNKDEYAFNNYFRNNYLPKVYSIPFKSPGRFEEDSRVNLAQDAINRARAAGDEQAVEAIKNQLRIDLGISNLGELIK